MTVDGWGRLLVALVAVVATARLCGALARRLGQPPVIGEILGGILLGPTLFGGVHTNLLFPAQIRPSLTILATIGVVLFMFFVGLEVDPGRLRGQGHLATSVSIAAVVLPFGLGALLATYLVARHPTAHRVEFVLFLGTAMAVTAFPVLARILTDKGLLHTPIGGLALASAAVGDVIAWALLAVVVTLADGGADPWRMLLAVPYVLLMLRVVRPLLARSVGRLPTGWLAGAGALAVTSIGLLASAAATEWMGLHAIFGAFLFGVVVPARDDVVAYARLLPTIERACSFLLLPVFFVVAGIKVDLSALDGLALGELSLILLVAIGGKAGGAFLGARLNGLRARHSVVLAILLNARGLTELIVLTVGLELGVLDRELFSLMVVMALVTTAMTGVLLRWVYPEERVRRDLAVRDEMARSGSDSGGPGGPRPIPLPD
ncbi:Kef-type K+ transport system, membrane component KefB [Micromonospora sediminicola]|uniref:Kef-type K+ transport system, membrane component KefB n=1 Tax=Micromonospora sediminicola TaxID=946078 RepID=A0A1A9B991_9ACTN|nr:cation:proton antiporter [Micromonospora sediminicola]SBT65708.1 Kef-type K+ transport system, membrane component KefB [Micromonospora sediminicola]